MLRALAVACFVLAGCSTPQPKPLLTIATTTSMRNSGLLDAILPAFTASAVRVHAAGSGRALQMLVDGEVPLVISHAPEAEQQLVAAHPGWRYHKFAFNHFVIVGPAGDPAGIRGSSDATTAFRRIADKKAFFISRGDQSGTHERERRLWGLAGVTPGNWLLISGTSMAQTLRQANEKHAYTLSDDSTFWQLHEELSLATLFEHDAQLLNTYAVIYRPDDAAATAFAEWLWKGAGRQAVRSYQPRGRTVFTIWPDGCPAESPDLLPCG